MIFCAFLAIVPASAAEVITTTDLVVDTNVYKGDYIEGDNNSVDSVIVWVDVKESKFDETLEYGTFIYSSCKDSNIVLENGSFNPAESGKSTFATRFEVAQLVKGIEYAIKGYVKFEDGSIKLSKTTAFFNANDLETKNFDLLIFGGNITYTTQETTSNYGQNQDNTQYFIYRDDELLGATNELGFNVIDDLFDEDGNFEETIYNITVKTVSGLNNGGVSNPYSFEMQAIGDAATFLQNVGTDDELDHGPKNVYQVLTNDIDLSKGATYKKRTIDDAEWKQTNTLHCLVRYFSDTLDGRGHKITIDYDCNEQAQDGSWFAGLFGMFCETGFVRNLVYDATAVYDITQTGPGGERATAFTMVGWGSYENCYMTAKLQSLRDPTSLDVPYIRRDAFIGYPGNYTATNVIANIELIDHTGNLIGDVKTQDDAECNYGTRFHWEGTHVHEGNHFIMVSPVTMGENNSVGLYAGKNITYYNTFDDLLTGTKGIILDQEGLASMDKGEYREGVAYESGWDEDIWEFNDEEGYIKFYDNVVYRREVIE